MWTGRKELYDNGWIYILDVGGKEHRVHVTHIDLARYGQPFCVRRIVRLLSQAPENDADAALSRSA